MLWLKAYPALLRAYWARALEYRAQSLIWFLSSVLPLIMMVVWLTVAEEQGGQVGGYNRTDFISYYLMVVFLRRLTGVWIIWDMDRDIRQGTLSPKLLRPIDPAHHLLTRVLAFKPLQVIMVGPPLLVGSLLLGAHYDLSLPAIGLTLVAMITALLIEFFAQMVIGCAGFWITQTLAIAEAWFFLRGLLSGWIVPLDLFPPALTEALVYLPFRYMLSFPLEIILGRLTLGEIGQGLVTGYLWLGLLFGGYRLLWRRGLKRYGAVGA